MQIEVKLHGTLRRYRPQEASGAPHHPFIFTVNPTTTVDQLARQLHIPEGLVAAAACNGEAVEATAVLQDDDSVALFPPTAGG